MLFSCVRDRRELLRAKFMLPLAGLTALLCITADLAVAQDGNRQRRDLREAQSQQRQVREVQVPSSRRESARRETTKREAPPPKPVAVGAPPEPLVAVISLPSQRINVYGSSGMVADSKISTGQSGFRTPTGVFSVLQRNRYHESNIYSGAPMPFMQRLTWSGIALHQGVVPGYPASHGCIRLPGEFATQMWGLGRIGMRVIVAPRDVAPTSIAHANLPVPIMTPVPAGAAPHAVVTASVAAPTTEGEQRLLDPFRLAHARKLKAQATQIAADKAVKPAFDVATEKSAEASRASEELRRAEAALPEAAEGLLEARAQMVRAQTPEAEDQARPAIAVAEQALDLAEKRLAAAKLAESAVSDAAFAAARAARDAEDAARAALDDARRANAGTEPVSIFVSRKEARVFVRQGFVPLHDEPISIVEPGRPLGTHVYTAIEAKDGGAALRWIGVTVPSNPPEPEADRSRKSGARDQRAAIPSAAPDASNAAGALERIELPEATRKLVADRLWPGASLTISDFGISGETGKGTDFIVLTK